MSRNGTADQTLSYTYNAHSHQTSFQLPPRTITPNRMRRSRSMETIDLDRHNYYPMGNTLHNNNNNTIHDEDDILLTQTTDNDNTQVSTYSTYIDLLASNPSSPASVAQTQEVILQTPQETSDSANKTYPEIQIPLEDVRNKRVTRNLTRLENSAAAGNPASKSA